MPLSKGKGAARYPMRCIDIRDGRETSGDAC